MYFLSTRNRITWSPDSITVLSWAISTSSSRMIAPMVVPGGREMSSILLPTTLLDLASPWAMASMASAAPRRRECTLTISPRRTWVSRVPMVAISGLMAMSISPPCTRST
ncbi:hypothetical protein D9M73_282620 [compost metagenome]